MPCWDSCQRRDTFGYAASEISVEQDRVWQWHLEGNHLTDLREAMYMYGRLTWDLEQKQWGCLGPGLLLSLLQNCSHQVHCVMKSQSCYTIIRSMIHSLIHSYNSAHIKPVSLAHSRYWLSHWHHSCIFTSMCLSWPQEGATMQRILHRVSAGFTICN